MPLRPAYPVAIALIVAGVGLLLTLCDHYFHVHFGVLSYAEPVFFGQAWWVWPNFAGAALGMYLGAKWLYRGRVGAGSAPMLVFSTAWFVAAYAATGLFAGSPRGLLAGLLLAWAIRVALGHDRAAVVVYSCILATVGCLIEGAGYTGGLFAYRDPEIFHVPYWLAGLYMNGSFVVLQIVHMVEARYGRTGPARG